MSWERSINVPEFTQSEITNFPSLVFSIVINYPHDSVYRPVFPRVRHPITFPPRKTFLRFGDQLGPSKLGSSYWHCVGRDLRGSGAGTNYGTFQHSGEPDLDLSSWCYFRPSPSLGRWRRQRRCGRTLCVHRRGSRRFLCAIHHDGYPRNNLPVNRRCGRDRRSWRRSWHGCEWSNWRILLFWQHDGGKFFGRGSACRWRLRLSWK